MRNKKPGSRRIIAFLLSAMLTLSLCTTAFAEEKNLKSNNVSTTEVCETAENNEADSDRVYQIPVLFEQTEESAKTEETEESVESEKTEEAIKTEEAEKSDEAVDAASKTVNAEKTPAVKAFLAAVDAIIIPEEINEETGEALNMQIGAAQDAYDALSEEELAREDVQAAVSVMSEAMDALTGGVEPLALITNEQFNIKVNLAYADGTIIESKTLTLNCADTTGHSGYNHSVKLNTISLSACGWSSYSSQISGWKLLRYSYWGSNTQTSGNGTYISSNLKPIIHYNITGSAPYRADESFWWIVKSPSYSYTVNHVYRTNGVVDGQTSNTVSNISAGTTINASSITKQTSYNSNTYTYTSATPTSATINNNNTVFTLYYDRTVAPNKPTENEVKNLLGNNAVKIDCLNTEVVHEDRTYGLMDNTFTIGSVTGNSSSGYTCTVAVNNAAPYVAQYITDMGSISHSLSPEDQGNKTFTLRYDTSSKNWTLASSKPVVYTVICEEKAPIPELTISKTVDKTSVTKGESIIYTISVSNTGEVALHNVVVRDILPDGLTATTINPTPATQNGNSLTWNIGTLEVEEERTITITATVTADANIEANTATATADELDGEYVSSTTYPITVTLEQALTLGKHVKTVGGKELTEVKGADGKYYYKIGDTIVWEITITNPNSTEKVVSLGESMTYNPVNGTGNSVVSGSKYTITGGDINWTDSSTNANVTVPANGSVTLTVTYTTSLDDVKDGSIENAAKLFNHVVISNYQINGQNAAKSTDSEVLWMKAPTDWSGLAVEKTADNTTVKPGDTVTYTLVVTNNTGKDLENITVSEKLDADLTFVSATGDGTYGNDVWMIETLANEGTATLRITATVNEDVADGTTIANTVTVTDASTDDGEELPEGIRPDGNANVEVNIPAVTGVEKTVVSSAEAVPEGITVPAGVSYPVNGKVNVEAGTERVTLLYKVTVTGESDAHYTVTDERATCISGNATGILPESGTVDVYFTKTFTGLSAGQSMDCTNTASVGEHTSTVTTLVTVGPDWSKLTVEKSVSTTGTVKPGDTVTYTLKVTNNTGKDLKNITVSEKLDAKLTFVKAEGDGKYADDVWTIETLADEKTATLVITVKVKENVVDGTKIANTAIVTGASADDSDLPAGTTLDDKVEITVKVPYKPVKPDTPDKPNKPNKPNTSGTSTSSGSNSISSASQSTSVSTGDYNSSILQFTTLLTFSLVGIVAMMIADRKKHTNR